MNGIGYGKNSRALIEVTYLIGLKILPQKYQSPCCDLKPYAPNTKEDW